MRTWRAPKKIEGEVERWRDGFQAELQRMRATEEHTIDRSIIEDEFWMA